MFIERNTYLNRLISRRENGMIKVVTGLRRCGKSFLLQNIFANYLLEDGVGADRITYVNLEDYANRGLRNADALYSYVKNRLHKFEMNYVILDEIQYVDGFEDLLNGLMNMGNKRYYVQSAYRMADGEKVSHEEAPLLNISDSFKKIIVVGDDIHIHRDASGITTMSVYDFLLNDNSLEM